MARASFERIYRELLYGRSTRDDTFELNIERAVVGFDVTADRNVARVVSDPKRELALLVLHQPLRTKQLRVHAQSIDAAEHRLQLFSLHDFHRDRVNASAVTDVDIEVFADLKWLGANEIDRREHVL